MKTPSPASRLLHRAVIHPMERCWLESLEITGPIVQAAHWQ
jgi:hypothetical protein